MKENENLGVMEVEMKALMNEENISKLFALAKDVEKVVEVKSDEYFSFNGENLKNPKKIVRLREVTKLYEGQDISDLNSNEVVTTQTAAALSFFKKNIFKGDKTKLWLTIKNKNTLEDGTEVNVEKETQIFDRETINALLDVVNFKSYFKKEKRAIGFYLQENGVNLHCELVSVNHCNPYLEVEAIVGENQVEIAKKRISDFFYNNFIITEFDGRNWNEIIG